MAGEIFLLIILQLLLFFLLWKQEKKIDACLTFVSPALTLAALLGKSYGRQLWAAFLQYRHEKRLIAELPVLVETLSTCLKAGLLPPEAISFTRMQRKWKSNIAEVLKKIEVSYAGGMAFVDAINEGLNMVTNAGMERFLYVTLLSLRTGYSTGGNLIQLLERLSTKVKDAVTLRRKAFIYTAQMRMQAMVVMLAPLFIFIVLHLIGYEKVSFFYTTKTGALLSVLMIALNITGGIFIAKMMKIEGI